MVPGESGRVLIVGAGLQGLSLALALAERGRPSLVLEREAAPFLGASSKNEGKVHLGFVYALDAGGATVRHMVEGAMTFAPLIERWCGPVDWRAMCSPAFEYVVMEDSLADPDALEAHYMDVLGEMRQCRDTFGSDYLGTEPDLGVDRHDAPHPAFARGSSVAWFGTPERSVDPRRLSRLVCSAAAAEPLIEIRTGAAVRAVVRSASGFRLELVRGGAVEAEQVANCSWEDRERLDRFVGRASPGINYRVKHQVMVRGFGGSGLPTVTMVQGPYGDLVYWGEDAYLSWYPVGRTWFGSEPPPTLEPDSAVAGATLEALRGLVPALGGARVESHAPCHIVAEARTDIEDRQSGLHRRAPVSIRGDDGWWSLSGGKLTTAPIASERCAALMTATEAAF
jgi:glycine/D-amino acid oxidase-like deaminating enzyme